MTLTLSRTEEYASGNPPAREGPRKFSKEEDSHASNSHGSGSSAVLRSGSKRPNQGERNSAMRKTRPFARGSRRRPPRPQYGRGTIQMYVDETNGNRRRQIQGRGKHGNSGHQRRHIAGPRLSCSDDGERRQVFRMVPGHGQVQGYQRSGSQRQLGI